MEQDALVNKVMEMRAEQQRRAKNVFDELTNGLPDQPNDDKDADYLTFLSDRMNKVIHDNLDADSIHHFLLLCGVNRVCGWSGCRC